MNILDSLKNFSPLIKSVTPLLRNNAIPAVEGFLTERLQKLKDDIQNHEHYPAIILIKGKDGKTNIIEAVMDNEDKVITVKNTHKLETVINQALKTI